MECVCSCLSNGERERERKLFQWKIFDWIQCIAKQMRNSHIPAESPFENKKEIGIWIIPNEFKILATYVTSSIPFSLGFFSLSLNWRKIVRMKKKKISAIKRIRHCNKFCLFRLKWFEKWFLRISATTMLRWSSTTC